MIKLRIHSRKLVPLLAVLVAGCGLDATFSTDVPSFETGFESGSQEDALLNLIRIAGTIVLVIGAKLGFGGLY